MRTNKNLNTVKVIFENSKYNYKTSVSANSTKSDCEKYFVGKVFNVSHNLAENIQTCIAIEFENNNA